MKAVDFRKGNTHSLASAIVQKADISVVKNVMIETLAKISANLNLMNVDLQ